MDFQDEIKIQIFFFYYIKRELDDDIFENGSASIKTNFSWVTFQCWVAFYLVLSNIIRGFD